MAIATYCLDELIDVAHAEGPVRHAHGQAIYGHFHHEARRHLLEVHGEIVEPAIARELLEPARIALAACRPRSNLGRRPLGEECANGVEHGFGRRQREAARGTRLALELLEQRRGLGAERLLRGRRRLDVTNVIDDRAELGERRLRALAIVAEFAPSDA